MQGPEFGAREITCQSNLGGVITSGGGFSHYYPKPIWQSTSTSGYLKNVIGTKNEPVAGYNISGRGYPDISLAGSKYLIIIGGSQYLVSGTSAAAPAVAGMISLVNAARLNAGRSPLGWINPILYANHQMFTNDVTSGKNNCTAGPICCRQGFQSTLGWDPATGFGSINFMAFKDFFMGFGIASPVFTTSSRPTSSPTSRPVAATLRPTAKAITSRPTSATLRPTPRPTAMPTPQPTVPRTNPPTKTPTRQPTRLLLKSSPKLSFPTSIPTAAPQVRSPFGSSRPPPSTQIAATFAPSFGIQKSKAKDPRRGPDPPLPGLFFPKRGGLIGSGPKDDDRIGQEEGKGKAKGKGKGKGGGKAKGKGK